MKRLVSATSELPGHRIVAHHGVVTAHIVAGANIFRDIAASWRDVFGGNSKAYQNKLDQMYDQALRQLWQKARQEGGNALVGLKIDHDPIENGGTNLFMLTAMANAVRAEAEPAYAGDGEGHPKGFASGGSFSGGSFSGDTREGTVSVQALKAEMRVQRALGLFDAWHEQSVGSFLDMDSESWQFFLEQGASEVVPPLMKAWLHYENQGHESERFETYSSNLKRLFGCLDREHAVDLAYHYLTIPDYYVFIDEVIQMHGLLDLRRACWMLEEGDFDAQRWSLVAFKADKPYYVREDIQLLRQARSLVDRCFPDRSEPAKVTTGFLTSKAQEGWSIWGGPGNPADQEYCAEHECDRYGFGRYEYKPAQARQSIQRKLDALCALTAPAPDAPAPDAPAPDAPEVKMEADVQAPSPTQGIRLG